MKKIFMLFMVALAALNVNAQDNFYGYTALDANEEEISMNDFKGKVLLVVVTRDSKSWISHATSLESRHQVPMRKFMNSAQAITIPSSLNSRKSM